MLNSAWLQGKINLTLYELVFTTHTSLTLAGYAPVTPFSSFSLILYLRAYFCRVAYTVYFYEIRKRRNASFSLSLTRV